MRTKTLLLTAALTAAGVATSMAQVYSVNMVGYINLSIGTGYSMIANQLNNSPDNKIVNVFPAPPSGTTLYKFNPSTGGYTVNVYISPADGGSGWEGDDLDMTLNPGEGTFISTETAFTQTLVGEVQLSSSLTISPGFQMISSVLPQSLPLDGAANDNDPAPAVGLGFPNVTGDTSYQFDRSTGGYIVDTYISPADGGSGWEGDSGNPVPDISEGFWLSRDSSQAASAWTRNFVVGVD